MNSVAVCTHNRQESLAQTLQALLEQKLPSGVELELLVVNNASTDGTPAVVERFQALSPWPLRALFEPRPGVSRARNLAVREARGDFIVFTDDDVLPPPTWLASLLEGQRAFDADGVGGPIHPLWLAPPPPWLAAQRFPSPFLSVLACMDHGDQARLAGPEEANFLYGANFSFRKQAFQELGGFREDLGVLGKRHRLGEDTEFLERFRLAGKRILYEPKARVLHKVPPERMLPGYFRNWKLEAGRSQARMEWKRGVRFPFWALREAVARSLRLVRRQGRFSSLEQQMEILWRLGYFLGALELLWHRAPSS